MVGRAFTVARVLFPVLTCGGTRSRPSTGRPSRTLLAKDTGNVIKGNVPRATTIAPTMDRRLEPLRRSITGAMACPRPAMLHSFFHSPTESLMVARVALSPQRM